MTLVTYTGQAPIHVVGVGDCDPGQTLSVSGELAGRLLARPDFAKKTPPRKAKAPAKATGNTTT